MSHHQRRASDPEAVGRRGKLKQLKRQLSNLRKKMEEMELEYQVREIGFPKYWHGFSIYFFIFLQSNHGYRPSQADKHGNRQMRKILSEQSQVKRQIRNCRDSDVGVSGLLLSSDDPVPSPSSSAGSGGGGGRRRDSVSSTNTEEDSSAAGTSEDGRDDLQQQQQQQRSRDEEEDDEDDEDDERDGCQCE